MVDKKEEIKALICGFPKSEVLTLESLGKTQGNTQCIFIYLFFQKIKNLHLKQWRMVGNLKKRKIVIS